MELGKKEPRQSELERCKQVNYNSFYSIFGMDTLI